MRKRLSGSEIRQSFIEFFISKGHTFVPSSSLVPGGDQTLLFTNAGMVQFKDVFLGTDSRPYTRAVNSQKCMRVAGKHNDLDDVGRDDTHHTFFEMLGNWSFGDYYKKEAITWAWELLTEIWGLDRSKLWATCFKDDQGDIPADEEAAGFWRVQPGIHEDHIVYCEDNFWEMADTGPCGPCSEIYIDLGPDACIEKDTPGHVCRVNGDCKRFLELWNLVFIQYNRLSPTHLEPLAAKHVDTGMGFERIVSVLQGTTSNYRTDLLMPLMDAVQRLTAQTDAEREANLTPYRVIADHSRAAAFLIADGVVPGNTGRNYICRMIIRRAARFGSKIGLNKPFLAKVADVVVQNFGNAYPELRRNHRAILDSLTREEQRFQRTVEAGLDTLGELLEELKAGGRKALEGKTAFELYATHGVPLEITRDIAREQGLDVEEEGFRQAMEEHRLISGAGKSFGELGGEDADLYHALVEDLISTGKLAAPGVQYDPYALTEVETHLAAILRDGSQVQDAVEGDKVEIVLPKTGFYVEAGGQVSDTGVVVSKGEPGWEIRIDDVRKPAAGAVILSGEVTRGKPHTGDAVIAAVDLERRRDVMRNHTATHLLHAELRAILGEHARQAGSLVAPDRLRFDFTHPEAVTPEQLEQIEVEVNRAIFEDHSLQIKLKPTAEAIAEGAMALFGEKYGDTVRTIAIGGEQPFSYELCGGTHVEETGDVGLFLIVSESSVAAGVRRIEAVTGRAAYELVRRRAQVLKKTAALLECGIEETPSKTKALLDELERARKQQEALRARLVAGEFDLHLEEKVMQIKDVPVLSMVLPDADADALRQMTDRFRERYPSGVAVLGSVFNSRPLLIAAVTDDLVKRGLHAGDLVKTLAEKIGGSGGGRPTLAQAGGKDGSRLPEAILQAAKLVEQRLK